MRGNVPKLYVANFLTGVVFWYGIEKLFMTSIGINPVGISIYAVTFILVSMSLDVPAGVLADKWSRKYTLVLGLIALAICSLIMGFSHNLPAYLLGTIFYGIYVAFTSGTYQAITYDSLLDEGREKQYVRHQGYSYGMFLIGISFSSIVGGFIAHHYGYRISYFLTIASALLTVAVLASLHEPKRHKLIEDTRLHKHIIQTVRLFGHTMLLRFLAILYIGTYLLNSTQFEYSGLYFIALGFGAIGSGFAFAGANLSGAAGQFLAAKLGAYKALITPLFFIVFAAFSIWRSPWGVVLFCTAALLESIITTGVEGDIQDHTPSHIRATTISLLTFTSNLMLIPVSLIFGLLAKNDVFRAYQFVAVIGAVFLSIWFLRPSSIRQPNKSQT